MKPIYDSSMIHFRMKRNSSSLLSFIIPLFYFIFENHRFESNLFIASSNNLLASKKIHYKNLLIQTFSTARLFSQHASSDIDSSLENSPSPEFNFPRRDRNRRQTKQKLHSLEGIEARETSTNSGNRMDFPVLGLTSFDGRQRRWLSRTKQRCTRGKRGGRRRGRRHCTWRVGGIA